MTTTTQAKPLPRTVLELKQRNQAGGGYWFTPDTLRFFSSRIMGDLFPGTDHVYFVSSERREGEARRYTVRRLNGETGRVDTVGDFQRYASRSGALRAAELHAIKERNGDTD